MTEQHTNETAPQNATGGHCDGAGTITVDCDVRIAARGDTEGTASALRLPPGRTYTMLVDYPFHRPYRHEFKTGEAGMGFAALLDELRGVYKRIYAEPDRFGVWGHALDELWLERVTVDRQNATVALHVGS